MSDEPVDTRTALMSDKPVDTRTAPQRSEELIRTEGLRRFFATGDGSIEVLRRIDLTIQRAARYLWAKQHEDGGWHSETYGLLRSGQSLTPFVLSALLEVPEEIVPRDREAVGRAIRFLAAHVNADGALGLFDPVSMDYPTYATALALRAVHEAADRSDLPARLLARMRHTQFAEPLGWKREHGSYGAWGMGGTDRLPLVQNARPGETDPAESSLRTCGEPPPPLTHLTEAPPCIALSKELPRLPSHRPSLRGSALSVCLHSPRVLRRAARMEGRTAAQAVPSTCLRVTPARGFRMLGLRPRQPCPAGSFGPR